MSEHVVIWIIGTMIAWMAFLTVRLFKTNDDVTKIKAVMITMSENAAKVLHSPHTPELDALLEKYIDRHYEMSWPEWNKLQEICDKIIHDSTVSKQERALASWIHAVAMHKLYKDPIPGNTMKRTSTYLSLCLLAACASLVLAPGCSSTPNAFERHFFDVQTNVIEVVHTVTNDVAGVPTPTLVTNRHEEYVLTPGEHAEALTESTSRVAGLFGPWGEIASVGLTGLFGLWATLRSSRRGKAANALAQSIEVARRILSDTPQGKELDAQFVQWLKTNQRETGVITEVAQILDKVVDTHDARQVADTIRAVVNSPAK